jgi:hypothetical protein
MTSYQMKLVGQLADAYRALRQAGHHEPPPPTDLQRRIDFVLMLLTPENAPGTGEHAA